VSEVPEGSGDGDVVRSRDEEAVGWGDEREEASWGRAEGAGDPDVERLLAERPPHHDRN
jgi:hypothetical protein